MLLGSVLFAYNECLIVIWSQLWSKEEGSKFGVTVLVIHQIWGCLPPPCDPKKKDLMQKEQLKVISMLVAMKTKDGLRRGVTEFQSKRILSNPNPNG